MKASPVHLWPHGARRKLHRVVAKPQQAWPSLRPQGLATHFHASLHLPEDMNCQYTWLVGPHLCWPPDGAVLPLQSQSVPQPRPLQLQDLASPCNVLILIKVQMGLGRGWGAQVWDEKGTALPHPYCMPPIPLYLLHLQLKTMHFTDITHTHFAGAGHPALVLKREAPRGPPLAQDELPESEIEAIRAGARSQDA